MKKRVLIILLGVFFISGVYGEYQPPADRLPAGGIWNPGIPGGIPNRTTICATLNPTGDSTDRTLAIQNALNNCPHNQVVYLNPGTYYVSGTINIPSHKVLRGAGMDRTFIRKTGTGKGVIHFGSALPWVGQGFVWEDWDAISGGYNKDSTSVIIDNSEWYSEGSLVVVSQADRNNPDIIIRQPCAWDNIRPGDWPLEDAGHIGQINLVSSVSGNTINLIAPMYYNYSAPYTPHIGRTAVQVTNAGLEDLTIWREQASDFSNSETNGAVFWGRATYCWAKGVKLDRVSGPGFNLAWSFGNIIHGCTATRAWTYASGGGGYQFVIRHHSANNLIENNIIHQGTPNFHIQPSSGNVVAYNFMDVSVTNGGTDWALYNVGGHCVGSHMYLFEGNQISIMADDNIYGNDFTYFHLRNHYDTRQTEWVSDRRATCTAVGVPFASCTGPGTRVDADSSPVCCDSSMATNNRAAIDFDGIALDWSVVGNVLGREGDSYGGYQTEVHGTPTAYIYRQVTPSTLRHGNFDYYYNQVKWCSEGDIEADCHGSGNDQTLPKSLYLSSKPSWWCEETPWPPIGPDVNGYVNDIPAKRKMDGLICTTGEPPPDTTPPQRTNPHPTTNLPAGTTSTTISLNTNELATCKYSNISGINYFLMQNTFSTTGALTHSQLITGLQNGETYTFYVRCNDSLGNFNTEDFEIVFSVLSSGEQPPPQPPQTTGIITLQDMLNSYQDYRQDKITIETFLEILRTWVIFR